MKIIFYFIDFYEFSTNLKSTAYLILHLCSFIAVYKMIDRVMCPQMRVLDKIVPPHVLTTADIGNAMLKLTRQGERGLILDDNQGIMKKTRNG